MDSTLLRFPYKIAQRLNRPYSRYKTGAAQDTDNSQHVKTSEPVYQEIDQGIIIN